MLKNFPKSKISNQMELNLLRVLFLTIGLIATELSAIDEKNTSKQENIASKRLEEAKDAMLTFISKDLPKIPAPKGLKDYLAWLINNLEWKRDELRVQYQLLDLEHDKIIKNDLKIYSEIKKNLESFLHSLQIKETDLILTIILQSKFYILCPKQNLEILTKKDLNNILFLKEEEHEPKSYFSALFSLGEINSLVASCSDTQDTKDADDDNVMILIERYLEFMAIEAGAFRCDSPFLDPKQQRTLKRRDRDWEILQDFAKISYKTGLRYIKALTSCNSWKKTNSSCSLRHHCKNGEEYQTN